MVIKLFLNFYAVVARGECPRGYVL